MANSSGGKSAAGAPEEACAASRFSRDETGYRTIVGGRSRAIMMAPPFGCERAGLPDGPISYRAGVRAELRADGSKAAACSGGGKPAAPILPYPHVPPQSVVVLRGMPGSGKSTFVAHIARDWRPGQFTVASADDYFVGDDGVYRFDPSRLPHAHTYCQKVFEAALNEGVPLVICDNTNRTVREVEVYHNIIRRYVEARPDYHRDPDAMSFRLFRFECRAPVTVYVYYLRQKHDIPWRQFVRMYFQYVLEPVPPMASHVREETIGPFYTEEEAGNLPEYAKCRRVMALTDAVNAMLDDVANKSPKSPQAYAEIASQHE